MKKNLYVAALAALAVCAFSSAFAANQEQATLTVTANIQPRCKLSLSNSGTFAFGPLDPTLSTPSTSPMA
jgi:hypothetical protein